MNDFSNLLGISRVCGQDCRHILDRIICLHIRGLVGHLAIARGVRFVETIRCKWLDEFPDTLRKILRELAIVLESIDELIAVAGTPTELARVSLGGTFDVRKIDGFLLTPEVLQTWKDKFSSASLEQMKTEFGVSPGRADVLYSGVLVLQNFCQALHVKALQVSSRGVRFGVALEAAKRSGQ